MATEAELDLRRDRGQDEALLRAIDENLAAFGRFIAQSSISVAGARAGRTDATDVVAIPPPATIFPVGAGFGIWTRSHADAALEATLPGAGFTRAMDLPVMVLSARPAGGPPLGVGIEIRRVVDASDVARLRALDLDGLAGTAQERAAVDALLGSGGGLLVPEVGVFTAFVDGIPAALALSFTHGDIVRIVSVGTAPAFRRRGLGAAVTGAAVSAGFDVGARYAVLESSAMGEPVYRSMGFREITRYRVWLAG